MTYTAQAFNELDDTNEILSMKKFHITGLCLSHKHYMADISGKLKAIVQMIENGEYFIINRPRQYGKTTMMYAINQELKQKEDYLVIPISFEGLGDLIIENEAGFCQWFFKVVSQVLRFTQKKLIPSLEKLRKQTKNLGELSLAITDFVEQIPKKVVLLIDEVDQSSKSEVFLKFLGGIARQVHQNTIRFGLYVPQCYFGGGSRCQKLEDENSL